MTAQFLRRSLLRLIVLVRILIRTVDAVGALLVAGGRLADAGSRILGSGAGGGGALIGWVIGGVVGGSRARIRGIVGRARNGAW